jgi:signal transduction histidine kinase
VSEALDDLMTLWSGVVDVDLQVTDEVLALLDCAPATRSTVLDVVAEGLTNAVRHGRAHSVVIRIAVESPGLVSIVVSDDGHGAPSVVPGMGSEMLDDVAHDWHLSVTPAGSVLTASVVVDPSVAVA